MDEFVVVDASVWVSWFIAWDVNYHATRLWMDRYINAGGQLVAPAFLLVEAAAAISRQTGQTSVAREAIRRVYHIPAMRVMRLDDALLWATIEVAADLQLRAGDATYVALARQLNLPLVSWDKEQLQKAGSLTKAYTPSDYAF